VGRFRCVVAMSLGLSTANRSVLSTPQRGVLGRSGGSGAWQSLSAGSDTAKTLRAPRAPLDDLASWLRIERKDSLRTRLRALDGDKLVLHHPKSGRYHIPRKASGRSTRRTWPAPCSRGEDPLKGPKSGRYTRSSRPFRSDGLREGLAGATPRPPVGDEVRRRAPRGSLIG
jgi:hypothetical protein